MWAVVVMVVVVVAVVVRTVNKMRGLLCTNVYFRDKHVTTAVVAATTTMM